jgi:intraflagellar transport protein 88
MSSVCVLPFFFFCIQAIETLKEFERKDQTMAGPASTNLSFLYFQEKDLKNAEKYANHALKADRFNARALVNKGNCLFEKGKIEEAKDLYQEALTCEADCIEALYNLGTNYIVHLK